MAKGGQKWAKMSKRAKKGQKWSFFGQNAIFVPNFWAYLRVLMMFSCNLSYVIVFYGIKNPLKMSNILDLRDNPGALRRLF